MQVFEVTYETRGTKILKVFLPEDKELPHNWDDMTPFDKDEWLYDNGKYTITLLDEQHEGRCVDVSPNPKWDPTYE